MASTSYSSLLLMMSGGGEEKVGLMVQWSDREIRGRCGIHHVFSIWREVGVCDSIHT